MLKNSKKPKDAVSISNEKILDSIFEHLVEGIQSHGASEVKAKQRAKSIMYNMSNEDIGCYYAEHIWDGGV